MEEGNFYKPAFEEKPKDIEEYKSRANPILQEHGQRIVKKTQYDLMKWGIIAFGVAVVILGYAVLNDSFKSTISCPICPTAPACPSVEIPSCPAFPNLSFPDCTNNCNLPNNLTIKLTNVTG